MGHFGLPVLVLNEVRGQPLSFSSLFPYSSVALSCHTSTMPGRRMDKILTKKVPIKVVPMKVAACGISSVIMLLALEGGG